MASRTVTVLTILSFFTVGATAMTPLDGSTGVVTGKVVSVDDKAMPDIVVKLLPPMMSDSSKANTAPSYTAKTDKDGQFRIDKVEVGAYRLTAGDKFNGVAVRDVTVAADQTVTLTIKLHKPPRR
jgi:hypothetical protein